MTGREQNRRKSWEKILCAISHVWCEWKSRGVVINTPRFSHPEFSWKFYAHRGTHQKSRRKNHFVNSKKSFHRQLSSSRWLNCYCIVCCRCFIEKVSWAYDIGIKSAKMKCRLGSLEKSDACDANSLNFEPTTASIFDGAKALPFNICYAN